MQPWKVNFYVDEPDMHELKENGDIMFPKTNPITAPLNDPVSNPYIWKEIKQNQNLI